MNKIILLITSFAIATISYSQVPNYIPSNGLVAWWPFTGNANDISLTGNNGTVTGATQTTDRNGNSNAAYDFTFPNNKIVIPYSSTLDISANKLFTVSCWINVRSINATLDNRIMYFSSIYGKSYDLFVYSKARGNDSMKVNFINYNSPSNNIFITSTLKLNKNTWYNIVLSVDGNTNISRLFINGNLEASSGITPVIPTSTSSYPQILTIGNHDVNSWGFDGKLDDIAVWKRILTPQEIVQVYNSGVGITTDLNDINFTISPDPVHDKLKINFRDIQFSNHKLIVFNNLGQLVYESEINEQINIIDISGWGHGIYYIRLMDEKHIYSKPGKFVL